MRFIFRLTLLLWPKQDEAQLREALKFANVCGAPTVTEKGAISVITVMPS